MSSATLGVSLALDSRLLMVFDSRGNIEPESESFEGTPFTDLARSDTGSFKQPLPTVIVALRFGTLFWCASLPAPRTLVRGRRLDFLPNTGSDGRGFPKAGDVLGIDTDIPLSNKPLNELMRGVGCWGCTNDTCISDQLQMLGGRISK